MVFKIGVATIIQGIWLGDVNNCNYYCDSSGNCYCGSTSSYCNCNSFPYCPIVVQSTTPACASISPPACQWYTSTYYQTVIDYSSTSKQVILDTVYNANHSNYVLGLFVDGSEFIDFPYLESYSNVYSNRTSMFSNQLYTGTGSYISTFGYPVPTSINSPVRFCSGFNSSLVIVRPRVFTQKIQLAYFSGWYQVLFFIFYEYESSPEVFIDPNYLPYEEYIKYKELRQAFGWVRGNWGAGWNASDIIKALTEVFGKDYPFVVWDDKSLTIYCNNVDEETCMNAAAHHNALKIAWFKKGKVKLSIEPRKAIYIPEEMILNSLP